MSDKILGIDLGSTKNIKSIENRYWDTDLPESSIDFALMADVYHEFSHPELRLIY